MTAAARMGLIQFCQGPLALEAGHGSPIPNEATADLIVMPRCRSSAREVGLRRPGVDAAEAVDDTGGVQEPSVSVVLPRLRAPGFPS